MSWIRDNFVLLYLPWHEHLRCRRAEDLQLSYAVAIVIVVLTPIAAQWRQMSIPNAALSEKDLVHSFVRRVQFSLANKNWFAIGLDSVLDFMDPVVVFGGRPTRPAL